MEKEFCSVQIGERTKQYEKGITYRVIAEEMQKDY